MHEVEWMEIDARDAMVRQVVIDLERAAECAIEARGCALLAVPGGKTPVPIFHALANRTLSWSKLVLLPTDDRLLAEDDPLSNAASILPGPDFEVALSGRLSRRACGIVPDPLPKEAPVARVTLTGVATRAPILTITGDEKRTVARQAMEDGQRSATAIGRVLAECSAPIKIFWCK